MTDLTETLEQMVTVLARCGETFWSNTIVNDLALLRKDDAYGAERFLTYFGGMGSVSDLWLCEANGHSVSKEREAETNAEFQALRARAWQLAKAAVGNAT